MNKVRVFLVLCAAAMLPLATVPAQQPPKPGPELEKLKALEGMWDVTASIKFGDVELESKGTETYKMGVGGRWLVSDFEGDFGGQKFQWKLLQSYDAGKKKYVSVWVDSVGAPVPLVLEGTYDKDGKVLTMTGETPGEDGKPAKVRMTSEMKDKDTIVAKMYLAGKDGKEQEVMTRTCKRKK